MAVIELTRDSNYHWVMMEAVRARDDGTVVAVQILVVMEVNRESEVPFAELIWFCQSPRWIANCEIKNPIN